MCIRDSDWTQRQYFLGAQDGYVTLYRVVNPTLGPIGLATFVRGTGILVTDLPARYQELITASISLGGLAEADGRIASLREVAAECRACLLYTSRCV